jgi:hypothetical protein
MSVFGRVKRWKIPFILKWVLTAISLFAAVVGGVYAIAAICIAFEELNKHVATWVYPTMFFVTIFMLVALPVTHHLFGDKS